MFSDIFFSHADFVESLLHFSCIFDIIQCIKCEYKTHENSTRALIKTREYYKHKLQYERARAVTELAYRIHITSLI